MTTRTIVTSQPDVACDVCERRLLRGEQHEVFLAAGQPRTVCELCAPRAAHQGWLRQADHGQGESPAPRSGRGRGLFERLRQVGRPAAEVAGGERQRRRDSPPPSPFDPIDDEQDPARGGVGNAGMRSQAREHADEHADEGGRERGRSRALADGDEDDEGLWQALELFNLGEYPRRIAGLARSLGAPGVSVRGVEGVAGVVTIVVAWELCWYRYRVDVDDPGAGAQLVSQGVELDQLEREERVANATASELGTLSLIGA